MAVQIPNALVFQHILQIKTMKRIITLALLILPIMALAQPPVHSIADQPTLVGSYIFPTKSAMAVATPNEDEYAFAADSGKTFKAQTTAPHAADGQSVIQAANGRFFVLQPDGGKYYISDFGILTTNLADTLTNLALIQKAADLAIGNELILDIDSTVVSISASSLTITGDLCLDLQGASIRVYPDQATDIERDFIVVNPTLDQDRFITIQNGKLYGPSQRGFNLDGTFAPVNLGGWAAIQSTGVAIAGANAEMHVDMYDIEIRNFFPNGVEHNGQAGYFSWNGGYVECAQTSGWGIFGTQKTAIIRDVEFRKCGYPASEVSGGNSYGVQIYFHPYVTTLIERCQFYDTPRAVQYSSGSAFYETTFDYEDTPVDYQIMRGCFFDSTITEKAHVNSWYYEHGVVEDCNFYCDGNAIQLVNSLTVSNCYFDTIVNAALVASFPANARNPIQKFHMENSEVRGQSILTPDQDTGDSDVRGIYSFENCILDANNVGFTTTSYNLPPDDNSYMQLNINNCLLTSITNNGVFSAFDNYLDVRVTNSVLDYKGGRFISWSYAGTNVEGLGTFLFENCKVINTSGASAISFIFSNNAQSVNPTYGGIKFKNTEWPDGLTNIGFFYQDPQQIFDVELSEALYPDTITTGVINLRWNYNTYLVDATADLTAAFFGGTYGGEGITNMHRGLGGKMHIIAVNDTVKVTDTNFNIFSDTLKIEQHEKITFEFNRKTRKWDQQNPSREDFVQ